MYMYVNMLVLNISWFMVYSGTNPVEVTERITERVKKWVEKRFLLNVVDNMPGIQYTH